MPGPLRLIPAHSIVVKNSVFLKIVPRIDAQCYSRLDGGKRELALFGRNITNKKAITGGIDFDNLTGYVNEPRIYGVQFRADL